MIMLRLSLIRCPVCLMVSLVIAARLEVGWLKAEETILFRIACLTLAILLGCLLMSIITRRILGPPVVTEPVTPRRATAPLVPGGEITRLCRFPLTGEMTLTTWLASPPGVALRPKCLRGHSGASPENRGWPSVLLMSRLPTELTVRSGMNPRCRPWWLFLCGV